MALGGSAVVTPSQACFPSCGLTRDRENPLPPCVDKTLLLSFEFVWSLREHQSCSRSFFTRPGMRSYFCTCVRDLMGILKALLLH